MAQKLVKCRYSHCLHSSKELPVEDAVKVGNYYMHQDCAAISKNIIEIRDYYYENVSNTVVMKTLMATINNIVFQKKVDAEYLLFAVKYAVKNRIPLRSPYGLHYLIDNARIKDAWEKNRKDKLSQLMKEACNGICVEQTETNFKYAGGSKKGFGSIFKH